MAEITSEQFQQIIDAHSEETGQPLTLNYTVKVDKPINLREHTGLIIQGGHFIIALKDAYDTVFDLTGSKRCSFRDVTITQSGLSAIPKCVFLLGRTVPTDGSYPPSANINSFRDCYIVAKAQDALIYNIGCELDSYLDCYFRNSIGHCYMACSWNAKQIRSPFGSTAGGWVIGQSGAVSNIVHWFERNHFGADASCLFGVVIGPNAGFANFINNSFSAKTVGGGSIYIGYHWQGTGHPTPQYGGVMIGNYAEYDDNATAWDIVVSTEYADWGERVLDYKHILDLNPGFRRGVLNVNKISNYPHPI